MDGAMFLFVMGCIIYMLISGKTPEKMRKAIKNCKEED